MKRLGRVAAFATLVLSCPAEVRASAPDVDSLITIVTSATRVRVTFQPSEGNALSERLDTEWVEAFRRTIEFDRIAWSPRTDPNEACPAPHGSQILKLVFEGPVGGTDFEYDFASGRASLGTPVDREGVPRVAWARERWGAIKNLARQVFPKSRELRAALLCPAPPPGTPRAVYHSPDALDGPVEAVRKVAPTYPNLAREAGVDGTVLLAVLVGEDGLPRDVRVIKGNEMLNDAARACVRQWEFKPPLSRGKSVSAWIEVPVRFSLH